MRAYLTLTFVISVTDRKLDELMKDFRLIVNESIRIANRHDLRSRATLYRAAYHELSRGHAIYRQHISSAFEVALSVLKAHRRRLRRGGVAPVPFVRRPMFKTDNQSYKLDRETGGLRLPIRAGEYVELRLPLSSWHRARLDDSSWKLGSLTIVPGKVLLALHKETPRTLEPKSAIALDSNEDSLDGVVANPVGTWLVTIPLGGVRQVQLIHFRRRRRLARKKAGDGRVLSQLLAREGCRERHRTNSRLHRISKELVRAALHTKSAIVLEDLTLTGAAGRSRRMNRRRSSWPRGELHRKIDYKAALAGVPVIKVNPAWTSKTCPACGARRRDRVGQDFVCLLCDWEMDRQHNAGLNILKTALASDEALARAVRFRPGGLRHDVVIPVCDLPGLLGSAREEPSGAEPKIGCLSIPTEQNLAYPNLNPKSAGNP